MRQGPLFLSCLQPEQVLLQVVVGGCEWASFCVGRHIRKLLAVPHTGCIPVPTQVLYQKFCIITLTSCGVSKGPWLSIQRPPLIEGHRRHLYNIIDSPYKGHLTVMEDTFSLFIPVTCMCHVSVTDCELLPGEV